MNKKVLMIVKNTFEFDNRVFRAADTLTEAGYEVTLLAYHRDGLKEEETLGCGFKVRRIKLYSNYGKRRLIYNTYKYIIFRRKTKKIADELKPDFIHCHDYNTLFLGLYSKKKYDSKLIYDCHEYFQDLNYLHRYPIILRIIIAAYERYAIKKVDNMIVVSPGIAKAYQNYYSKDINVIRNIPNRDSEKDRHISVDNKIAKYLDIQKYQKRKLLLYLGRNTSRGRGLNFVFDLIKELSADFGLVIFGVSSDKEKSTLQNKAVNMNIHRNIKVFQPIKVEVLFSVAQYFHFGISLIEPIYFSYKHSLPNKFFEYIAMGLPILSSDIPDQKDVILKYNNGLILDLDNVHKSKKLIENYGYNSEGVNKAQRELTWQFEKHNLINLYNSF